MNIKIQDAEEYIPYGEDWEKEMMKLPKKFLIEQLKNQWQQSQQPKEADGWISVEDRLPDYDQKVLVFGESKAMNPSMGGAYIMIGRRQDLSKSSLAKDAHRYQDENQFSQMSYVTHWQPLPLPPKNNQ